MSSTLPTVKSALRPHLLRTRPSTKGGPLGLAGLTGGLRHSVCAHGPVFSPYECGMHYEWMRIRVCTRRALQHRLSSSVYIRLLKLDLATLRYDGTPRSRNSWSVGVLSVPEPCESDMTSQKGSALGCSEDFVMSSSQHGPPRPAVAEVSASAFLLHVPCWEVTARNVHRLLLSGRQRFDVIQVYQT